MITGEFLDYNNVVVSEDEKGYKVSVEITDRTLNPFDMVHGGLTFSLGDTVMGLETRKISGGKTAVTLNASIEFLRPGKGKYLIARFTKSTAVLLSLLSYQYKFLKLVASSIIVY